MGKKSTWKVRRRKLSCKCAHTSRKSTHQRPHICGGLGVNVIYCSLWSESPLKCQLQHHRQPWNQLLPSPSLHATVKGQQQPLIILSLHPKVKVLTRQTPVGADSSSGTMLKLKKHRCHDLSDWLWLWHFSELQPAMMMRFSQCSLLSDISNRIYFNLQLTVNHISARAAWKAQKTLGGVRWAQYATQHSSVCRILVNVNLASVVYTARSSASCVRERR